MATLESFPDRPAEDFVGARLRRLRVQALALLPGAVALFVIQALGLWRPARPSLAVLPHFGLLSSAMWTAGGVLLLSILLLQRPVLRTPERAQQLIRAFTWTLTFALGALLFGVVCDVFVALDIMSGSWTLAAAVASSLMALAAWICW